MGNCCHTPKFFVSIITLEEYEKARDKYEYFANKCGYIIIVTPNDVIGKVIQKDDIMVTISLNNRVLTTNVIYKQYEFPGIYFE